ncbi:hypothetical protein GGI21_001430, partial [Coemansia aciculifera]
MFVTGLVIPYNSDWFINDRETGESAESSTSTYVFDEAKVYVGAHIINAVLLLTAHFDYALLCSRGNAAGLGNKVIGAAHIKPATKNERSGDVFAYCLAICSIVASTIWALSNISFKYAQSIISSAVGVSGFIG